MSSLRSLTAYTVHPAGSAGTGALVCHGRLPGPEDQSPGSGQGPAPNSTEQPCKRRPNM